MKKIREKMREEETYRLAMEQFLAQKPRVLRKAGTSLPKRGESHDR